MIVNKPLVVIICLMLATIACVTPATIPTFTPEASPTQEILPTLPFPTMSVETIYNRNPELALDNCEQKSFYTREWGWDFYFQCTPKDYIIYSLACNVAQVDIDHTGKSYSFMLGGRCGRHGFEFNVYLPATCSVIDVSGIRNIFGPDNQYSMQGTIGIAGSNGIITLNTNPIRGNGDYLSQFYVKTNKPDTYVIRVYFVLPNPDSDTRSYATINSIIVHPVSSGHCEGAPSI